MSIRTLIEINHDFCDRLEDGFLPALQAYLRSGDRQTAEGLDRYGLRVVSQRHHSGKFHVRPGTEGFSDAPIDTAAAAKQLGVSASYLNKLRLTGGGPVFLKLGAKVVYERDALKAWADACRRTSTAQEKAA